MKRQLDRDAYYSRVLVDCFSNGPVFAVLGFYQVMKPCDSTSFTGLLS
jgi:hypothetical protein